MLRCPFCDAPETDRFDLEGRRFLVFRCLFTPEVDPRLSDEELAPRLSADFGEGGTGYFREQCDRLHRYVTKGPGANHLRAVEPAEPPAKA